MPHGNVRSEEEVREAALQTPRPQTDNNPHSPAPCTAQGGEVGRGVRNEGVKLSLEKDREGAGVISIFVFVSRYPNLFYLQINQIYFPPVKSVLSMTVSGK